MEIIDRADYLNSCFRGMVTDTQDALHESKVDPRRIVNILQLPDSKFTYTPREFFDSLKAAADVIDLFSTLAPYWNHLNYYLLEKFIMASGVERLFGDNLKAFRDLKDRMKRYVEEIEHFRRRTAIKVYCEAIPPPPSSEKPPKGFKKLVKKSKSNLKTLQDVELFRQEVAREYKLLDCLVFLKKLKIGSVIITLWIPICAELEDVLSKEEVVSDDDEDNEGSSVDPPNWRESQVHVLCTIV